MARLLVSLEITSEAASLAELEELLGVQPHRGSHDKGAQRPRERAFESTAFKVFSPPEAGREARERLGWLAANVPPQRVRAARERLPLEVSVSVARLFGSASCTFELDAESLGLIQEYGASLELIAYPTD
jgi:hypothetical protein